MPDPDLPEIMRRVARVPAAMAADLAVAGGVLRCGTCGAEQPLGDITGYLGKGWPQCCDQTMTWVTRKLLLAERREVPDGHELVAVVSDDWRLEAGWKYQPCACKRYSGPEPLPLFYATETVTGTGE
jgi:hypothetical protein